jgi:hypothetical protein
VLCDAERQLFYSPSLAALVSCNIASPFPVFVAPGCVNPCVRFTIVGQFIACACPAIKGWALLNTAWETTQRKQVEDALRASEELGHHSPEYR